MGPPKADSPGDEACLGSVKRGIDSVTGKGTIQHLEGEIHFNVLLTS